MQPNLQETADSVAFTEEIPNEKLFCALYVDSVFLLLNSKRHLVTGKVPFITQPTFTCSKLTIETLEQRCEVCSKLTIKPPKRGHWRRFCSFIDKFEHISHLCSSVSIVNFEQVNAGWEYSATNAELQTQVKIFAFISSS